MIPERNTPRNTPTARGPFLLIIVAVLLAIASTYAASDRWSTAAGVLCGGGIVLVAMWVSMRRAVKHGAEAATATRVLGGRGDERDQRVYLISMAIVGTTGFAASALLPVAVQLGLSADTALGVLPYLLIISGVVAFVIADRRG